MVPNPHHSTVAVRSPADLLALLPYLIGHVPIDSLVAVCLDRDQIIFTARIDLPTEPNRSKAGRGFEIQAYEIAETLAAVSVRQNPTSVALIGYGTQARVTPTLTVATSVYRAAGLPVLLALRVTDGRWFHDACTWGCPAEGTPFDPSSSPAAAHAVYAGLVALPDRASYAARLAPIEGPEHDAMAHATTRAARRLGYLLDRTTNPGVLHELGRSSIRDALRRYQQGDRLTDDETAMLTVLLRHIPIRDHAWSHTDGTDHHVALWTDVTRRAHPDLVPAPASLLAFAAWRRGDGTLATLALDRALHADPGYRMAQLLRQVIQAGMPPSVLDGWTA